MKFTISRADMEYGIGLVMGAVDKKKLGDYAGSILVHARGLDRVHLQATDMELWASIALEAAVETPGMVVLPADKIASAIKVCGAGEAALGLDADLKTVLDGTLASYEISGLDPANYPAGYDDSQEQELVLAMPAGKMGACIGAVLHAGGNDVTKYHLCGINFSMTKSGRLTAAATDGHRLSIAGMDLPGECILKKFESYSITLPSKAASLLSRVNHSLQVGRVKDKNRLYFQSDSIAICSAEIVHAYPDYRRTIPTGTGEVIIVDTGMFIEALESCCVMSDDQYRSVHLRIVGEKIHISALGKNSTARASVQCLSESDITLRCNSRYLIQALKSIDSQEVFIKYIGPRSPILLIPADHGQWDERLELIMPLGD